MSSVQHPEDFVSVWDPFIRVFHWSLVVLFAVAFVTEDDALLIHVWAGYFIGLLLALRFVWGLVGPHHARFTDSVYSPSRVWAYLQDLLRFHARRYLGHSPAGGAMVVVLILALGGVVLSGLILYGMDLGAGPFPGLRDVGGHAGKDIMEGVHEFLANLTLGLVCAHIAGVLLASFVHRENLVRAMITGRKRRGE